MRERFDAYGEYDDVPRYNIAPSQPVLAIRQEPSSPRRSFSTMRWGLVPSWTKDPTIGFRTINARSESVTTTPSFREPFKSQRKFQRRVSCLANKTDGGGSYFLGT